MGSQRPRALSASLGPSRHQLLYVARSGLTPRYLYRELCLQLSIEPSFHAADARRQLTRRSGTPSPSSNANRHHLKVAGVGHALFSEDAARLIYQYTKGIPRQVNNLCTAALLAGYSAHRKIIEESTVKQALLELQDETAG